MRGDSGVAGEGTAVGIPKFHSWGKFTMPLTNINSDRMSKASSDLCIILYYIILYYIILYYIIFEQSNRTPRCSQKFSPAGLSWLEHFRVQCDT